MKTSVNNSHNQIMTQRQHERLCFVGGSCASWGVSMTEPRPSLASWHIEWEEPEERDWRRPHTRSAAFPFEADTSVTVLSRNDTSSSSSSISTTSVRTSTRMNGRVWTSSELSRLLEPIKPIRDDLSTSSDGSIRLSSWCRYCISLGLETLRMLCVCSFIALLMIPFSVISDRFVFIRTSLWLGGFEWMRDVTSKVSSGALYSSRAFWELFNIHFCFFIQVVVPPEPSTVK